MYPMTIKDIMLVAKENIIAARIGSDLDTYLQHVVKAKRLDLLKFFLEKVPEISLLEQNTKGNTVLHCAIVSKKP